MASQFTILQKTNLVLIIVLWCVVVLLVGGLIWQHFYYKGRLDEARGRLGRLEKTQDSQKEQVSGFTQQISSLFGDVGEIQAEVRNGFGSFARRARELMQKMELILDRQSSIGNQLAAVSKYMKVTEDTIGGRIKSIEERMGNLYSAFRENRRGQKGQEAVRKKRASKRIHIEVEDPEGAYGWKDEYVLCLKPKYNLRERYGVNSWKPFAIDSSAEKPGDFPHLPDFRHDMQRFLIFEFGDTRNDIFYGVADFDKPEYEYFPFDLYVDTDQDGELEQIWKDSNQGTFRVWVPYNDDDSDQYAIEVYSYIKKGPEDPGFSYQVKSARGGTFRANKKVIQVLVIDETGNGKFNDEQDELYLDWDLDGMIECDYHKAGGRPLYKPFGIGGEIYRVARFDSRGRTMVIKELEPHSLSAKVRAGKQKAKGLSPRGRAKEYKQFFTGGTPDRFSIGGNHLMVYFTNPVSPAKLDLGQKLHIGFQYKIGSAEKVRIFARPYTNGKRTSGYRAHPSPVYKKAESETGQAEGYFYFDEPTRVDQVKVKMIDTKTSEPVCVTSQRVNFQWTDGDERVAKQPAVEPRGDEIRKGQPFPELQFESLSGKRIDIGELEGKVILLDYWATWCRPCVNQMPEMVSLYRDFHDRGFEVIGINMDRDKARLEDFLEENNIDWPQYFDGGGWDNKISNRFEIHSIPHTVLLNREGDVYIIDPTAHRLRQAVENLCGGK